MSHIDLLGQYIDFKLIKSSWFAMLCGRAKINFFFFFSVQNICCCLASSE